MSRKLSMGLLTVQGVKKTISMDYARTDLTADQVRSVAAIVVTDNIFNNEDDGDYLKLKSAEVVITTKETLI